MPSNHRSSSIEHRHRHGSIRGDRDRFDGSGSRGRSNMGGNGEKSSPRSRDRDLLSGAGASGGNNSGSGRDRSPLGHTVKLDQASMVAKMQEESTAPWSQGLDSTKKRFTGRCRLFVGNLPGDLKEEDLRELFGKFGEIAECYLSGKGFGFVRLDTRAHAEVAKEELDGFLVKGRPIRVRFAVHGAAVKVKGLSNMASNELLHQAFGMFGEVERSVHIVDDRGRPTGEGIVEFERKPGAMEALRRINEGVFLLTANPRPIMVEPLEPKDDDDGLVERMITKNPHYHTERSQPPRFAVPGTFEFDFGNRWKELYQMERVKREQLEQELKEARERLENDMELAYQEYQAAMMREDLKRRQEELERLEAARRDRLEVLRRQDEEHRMRNVITSSASQASIVTGLFPGGYPRMGNFGGPPGQQQPQMQQPPPSQQQPYPGPGNRQDNMPFGRPQPREDNNLVHGVQKLLQMFQNDSAAGGFGVVPTGVPPPGIGLLGHQPPDAFFGGPEAAGMQEARQQQQHGRDRDNRGGYDSSRRRHH